MSGEHEAFQKVEETLMQVLHADSNNLKALSLRGQERLEHSCALAKQGNFDDSGKLTNQAVEDLDRALALNPRELQAHLTRGMSYAQFPAFLNKGVVATEDLSAPVKNELFAALETEMQARVYLILSRTYDANGQTEKAAKAFRNSIKADRKEPAR